MSNKEINMKNFKIGFINTAILSLCASSWGDNLPNYSVEILPSIGGSNSKAIAINDLGVVVGMSTRTDEADCLTEEYNQPCEYATLWQGGVAIDLGHVASDSDYAQINAINNNGEIVGLEIDHFVGGGYISKPIAGNAQGIYQLPLLVEGTGGVANDINDFNVVVGWGRNENEQQQLVSWNNNTVTALQESPDYYRWGLSINNTGWISGLEYRPYSGQPSNGFVLKNNSMTALSSSQYYFSEGQAISDYGVIAGTLADREFSQPMAAIWVPTFLGGMEVIKLGALNHDVTSTLLDINNLGQAVGHSMDENGVFRGTITSGFNLYDLNDYIKVDDGTIIEANGINSLGQVVGTLSTSSGLKAVLLTPIP